MILIFLVYLAGAIITRLVAPVMRTEIHHPETGEAVPFRVDWILVFAWPLLPVFFVTGHIVQKIGQRK